MNQEPSQIQDLADQIPEITKTAAGRKLKYHLRIELKADDEAAPEIANKLNKFLKNVSDDLQLKE